LREDAQPNPTPYTYEKYKFNGDAWGTYTVYPLVTSGERWVMWEPRGTYVHHYRRDWTMQRDHLQFLFPKHWYVISADYNEDRRLRHCYCDIIAPWQPPAPGSTRIYVIDLELDLAAEPSGQYRVLDSDEFEQAIIAMHYPADVIAQAQSALQRLIVAAVDWSGPFSQIPLALPRADFHTLDPGGDEWRVAIHELHLA
jgi:protein associated with RNAse G/E